METYTGEPVRTATDFEQRQRDEVDFFGLAQAIWRQKLLVVVTVVCVLVLAVTYLHLAEYKYTATLKVTPAQTGAGQQLAGQLGGLASLAGVSLPPGSGTASFQLYREGVNSLEIANLLAQERDLLIGAFPEEWNNELQRWEEPRSVTRIILTALKKILGVPVRTWRIPDGTRLLEFMQENVSIIEVPKKSLMTVSLEDSDTKFALKFVTRLHEQNDQVLRARTLHRTNDYIRYLSGRLARETVAEYRVSLAESLSEQERIRMVALSNVPFAADPFGPATLSPKPTTPMPALVLTAALLLGLVFGGVAALLTDRLRSSKSNVTHDFAK